MKKKFIMLSIIGALTACSSTKNLQETKDLNQGTMTLDVVIKEAPAEETIVEEVAVETTVDEKSVVEALEENTESMKTLYDKNGLLITNEEETETLYDRSGLLITSDEETTTLILPEDVVFDFDKYNVKDKFKPVLNSLAEALTVNEDLKVVIDGYTDNIGSKEYNDKLSLERADSAKNYLVDMNIAKDRIETIGHGTDNPIASNKTEEGRAENRRVEVTVTK